MSAKKLRTSLASMASKVARRERGGLAGCDASTPNWVLHVCLNEKDERLKETSPQENTAQHPKEHVGFGRTMPPQLGPREPKTVPRKWAPGWWPYIKNLN